MNKGQLTFGIGAIIATGTLIASVLTSYFTTANTQDRAINASEVRVTQRVTDTNERVAKLEEAVTTIKESQIETQKDIKEILRRIK